MRRRHFEALKPLCPACRLNGRESELVLGRDAVEDEAGISSGLLHCTVPECRSVYPIIDGMPVLVPDLDAWLAANGHLVLQRQALPDGVENVVGHAMGPDAAFNVVRQQQASYAFDHYGDIDPDGCDDPLALEPGAVRRCLAAALAPLPPAHGPVLDIGCAVGRTSFDLAAASDELVLGIDLNWPLIRMARDVLAEGVASYPHRINGLNFMRRHLPARFAGAERVDFWVADALCLPFRNAAFGRVIALNVLDCVTDPARLLAEMIRVGSQGAGIALATPFDWAGHATPQSGWLAGPDALENLIQTVSALTQEAGQGSFLPGPAMELEWQVRLHDRAAMRYVVHLTTGTAG